MSENVAKTEKKKEAGMGQMIVTLAAICAVCALLLGLVNMLTEPVIEANETRKKAVAMQEVLPADIDDYKAVTYTGSDATVLNVYEVAGKGHVVEVDCAAGSFSGTLAIMVGINEDGTISGVKVTNTAETSGLGSKADDVSFKDQYVGKSGTLAVDKDGGEIIAITGATITSRAVTAGVNSALAAVDQLGKGAIGKNEKHQLKEGLLTQNPVTVQLLGMCSTMAITTSLFNGIGMGLSVMVILTLANVFISVLRNVIPNKIRIACFIVVIATFVTMVDLFLKAYMESLSASLGVFIPLIVVNCIILGRAESFAYKNGVAASALDGIFQGLGYTWVLVVMCVIREFLGAGKFGGGLLGEGGNGIVIFPEEFAIAGLSRPVGGFLVLAFIIAAVQYFLNKPKKAAKKEEVAQ